jgi:hypothetical protein
VKVLWVRWRIIISFWGVSCAFADSGVCIVQLPNTGTIGEGTQSKYRTNQNSNEKQSSIQIEYASLQHNITQTQTSFQLMESNGIKFIRTLVISTNFIV